MTTRMKITLAQGDDARVIDHIRHDVYAAELRQFRSNTDETLRDRAEVQSVYIAAFDGTELIGFVGITPPSSPRYSIENHVRQTDLNVPFDEHLFEIRALTVVDQSRGSFAAAALMYAAFRWIQAHGGNQVIAIGHRKVSDMYVRLGMRPIGERFQCGELDYEPLAATIGEVEAELTRFEARLKRLEARVDWDLGIPFRPSAECYHGGAFFEAIGDTFSDLARRDEIINADVLDAWFPPCPAAQAALHEHMSWIMRTSPPNHAEGLVKTIAAARGVEPRNILPGGGSSPLIFLALRHWLTPESRVLILDPMYGEYAHVLEKVVGCRVDRFKLERAEGYEVDPARLAEKLEEGFDLVAWVNPNSPTGRHVPRADVEAVLRRVPRRTKIWIDETYVEYVGSGQSLEAFAAKNDHVVVVKSMSKVYGLSGLRAGYLCGTAKTLAPLRGLTPPWSVSLPAQVAAVKALESPDYYAERYEQTHRLRAELIDGLREIGVTEIVPGVANFVLFHLPDDGPDGESLIGACRDRGLFIRDAAEMGSGMGDRAIRVAVKDAETNRRALKILGAALARTEVCRGS